MNIVLQHSKSSLYMVEPGNWTSRWEEAKTFANSEKALEFVKSCRLVDLQIVLKWPGEKHDVVLAVPEAPERVHRPAQNPRYDWNGWYPSAVPAQ
jgi:hypothetical protein